MLFAIIPDTHAPLPHEVNSLNILLVNAKPSQPQADELEPLGLCYLSSYLKSKGHSSRVVHHTYFTPVRESDFIAEVQRDAVAMVGFTLYEPNVDATLQLCRALKRGSNALTVLGGPEATALPELALRDEIDFVVYGEGEIPIVALADALDAGRSLENVPGLIWRDGDKNRTNPPPARIRDIDDLPFPDRNDLPIDRYHLTGLTSPFHRGRVVSMITSRGCPYNCSYCMTKKMWQSKWIPRDPDDVMREFKEVQDTAPFAHMVFTDQDMLIDKKRSLELCRRLSLLRPKIEWITGINILHLDAELIVALEHAGCKSLFLGVESSSEKNLEQCNRVFDFHRTAENLHLLRKSNIFTSVAFLVGFPDDDKQSMRHLRRFARNLECDLPLFSLLSPYHGTELRRLACKNGWIDEEDNLRMGRKRLLYPQLPTYHLSRRQVYIQYLITMISVYLSPRFLAWTISGLIFRRKKSRYIYYGLASAFDNALQIVRFNLFKRFYSDV